MADKCEICGDEGVMLVDYYHLICQKCKKKTGSDLDEIASKINPTYVAHNKQENAENNDKHTL